MTDKNCGTCDQFRKKPFTTVFECLRYKQCLVGKPPMKCKQCIEDEERNDSKKKGKPRKDFIDVI